MNDTKPRTSVVQRTCLSCNGFGAREISVDPTTGIGRYVPCDVCAGLGYVEFERPVECGVRRKRPTRSILYWKPGEYEPACNTDIRRLFAKVREELRKAHEREAALPINVQQLQARKASK